MTPADFSTSSSPAAVATPERYLDAQARFHSLGTDPKSDPILMKRGLVAGLDYDKIQSPLILTSPGSRYAILLLADVGRSGRWFIAPLERCDRRQGEMEAICRLR